MSRKRIIEDNGILRNDILIHVIDFCKYFDWLVDTWECVDCFVPIVGTRIVEIDEIEIVDRSIN